MPCQISAPLVTVAAVLLAVIRLSSAPSTAAALAFAVQALYVYHTWPQQRHPRKLKWVYHGTQRVKPRRKRVLHKFGEVGRKWIHSTIAKTSGAATRTLRWLLRSVWKRSNRSTNNRKAGAIVYGTFHVNPRPQHSAGTVATHGAIFLAAHVASAVLCEWFTNLAQRQRGSAGSKSKAIVHAELCARIAMASFNVTNFAITCIEFLIRILIFVTLLQVSRVVLSLLLFWVIATAWLDSFSTRIRHGAAWRTIVGNNIAKRTHTRGSAKLRRLRC